MSPNEIRIKLGKYEKMSTELNALKNYMDQPKPYYTLWLRNDAGIIISPDVGKELFSKYIDNYAAELDKLKAELGID